MRVLIVIGPYTMMIHYRYLAVSGVGHMDYDVLGVVRRLPDGTRDELDADEAMAVAARYEEKIDEALFEHAETPDEFNAWARNQPVAVRDDGSVTYEDCMRLAQAAYQAAHEYKGSDEDRRDAKRYRTLRRSLSGEPGSTSMGMPCVFVPLRHGLTYSPEGLDEALDNEALLLGGGE